MFQVQAYVTAAATALAATGLYYAVLGDDTRSVVLGANAMVAGIVVVTTVWALGRVSLLVRAYRAGYRAGRNDASVKLLECGLWLATKAEEDAAALAADDDMF